MLDVKFLNIDEDPLLHISKCKPDDPASVLNVFPTIRNIRRFHQIISSNGAGPAVMSPFCYEMNRFIEKCLDPGGMSIVPGQLRALYLQRAISNMDLDRLSGLFRDSASDMQKNFISFASAGMRILRFLDEIYAEKITGDVLKRASLYTDYEEHIAILEEIAKEYRNVLSSDGMVDQMFLKQEGATDIDWLEDHKKINVLVGGYLTRFEIDLIRDIEKNNHVELVMRYEGEADKRTNSMCEMLGVDPPSLSKRKCPEMVEIRCFDEAAGQFGFILHAVERSILSGIPSEDIVVVLPDEKFKRVMFGLDRGRIFNFAMGLDQRDSVWFSLLKIIADLYLNRTENGSYDSGMLIDLINHPFIMNIPEVAGQAPGLIRDIKKNNRLLMDERDIFGMSGLGDLLTRIIAVFTKERTFDEFVMGVVSLIDDISSMIKPELIESLSKSPEFIQSRNSLLDDLYGMISLGQFGVNIETDSAMHLNNLIEQLSTSTYSDVAGGHISVMGMLETRNMTPRAVIIPDMNEEYMPPRSEKEMFLNSSVRETIGIPTYFDREDLARHYFYSLVKNADMVFLSYVDRDDRSVRSRFLEEILIEKGITGDDPPAMKERRTHEDLIFNVKKDVGPLSDDPVTIPKSATALKTVRRMSYTPYKLRTFRQCSYRFYLMHVKGFKEPVEVAEELEARDIGNMIHDAMRSVYQRVGRTNEAKVLHQIIREEVQKVSGMYDIFHVSAHAVLERDVLVDKLYQFALNEVRRFEQGWKPEILEEKFEVKRDGLIFSGRVDRIDIREDDDCRRAVVIDYKYSNIKGLTRMTYDSSFSEFQLPLYRMMLKSRYPELIVDGMGYYDLKDTMGLVMISERGTEDDFLSLLDRVTEEILSPEREFIRTEDRSICMRCGFVKICGRT
ncbi:MAG: PD-(D/E)XK nuclease family protein [Nitrospirota bacterium]|nr:MAG: PD-(D/E)XK nuclease family protein [Nitrospirota bacterium]